VGEDVEQVVHGCYPLCENTPNKQICYNKNNILPSLPTSEFQTVSMMSLLPSSNSRQPLLQHTKACNSALRVVFLALAQLVEGKSQYLVSFASANAML